MTIPQSAIDRLIKKHPHSEPILTAFLPLLEAQEDLAASLPAPELPPLDETAYATGTAWLGTKDKQAMLDEAFLERAPGALAEAAAKGFPAVAEAVSALGALLTRDHEACRELALLVLTGKTGKIRPWAETRDQDEAAVTLMAAQLAGTAIRRAQKAAVAGNLPPWIQPVCPICGSRPHGSAIRGKEGKRWLQCSLCRHEWLFSRTSCPNCLQQDPQKMELFFFEESKTMRAEVCAECRHYLLSVDCRELAEETPLELFLLCMMPLDLLMQEKKFTPLARAKARRA